MKKWYWVLMAIITLLCATLMFGLGVYLVVEDRIYGLIYIILFFPMSKIPDRYLMMVRS